MAFVKGQSGNPSGRPKEDVEFKLLAKQHSEKALKLLIKIMNDAKSEIDVRLRAAIYIIERAHGKPIQEVKNVQANQNSAAWRGAIERSADVDPDTGHVNIRAKKASSA